MVHADGVSAPVYDLNAFKNEPALGVWSRLAGAGQPSVRAGYQHQHVEVVREVRSFRAVHHLSPDIGGFLCQKRGLSQVEEKQRSGQSPTKGQLYSHDWGAISAPQ